MNKIRILYVINGGKYGSDLSLLKIIDGLQDKVEPFVLLPYKSELSLLFDSKNIRFKKIALLPFAVPFPNSFKKLLAFFPFLIIRYWRNAVLSNSLLKVAREFNPDIIHTNVGVYRLGYKIARQLNIKHVWHIREYVDLDFNNRYILGKNQFIKLLKDPINKPIAITRGIYDYFRMNDPAIIVYDGIKNQNDVFFNKEKQKYFLFVGNVTSEKGFDYLLISFAKFSSINKDFKLLIAGDCKNKFFKKRLFSIISSYSLEEKVQFLGYVTNIDELMRNATALVVPSKHEALGRIVAEAMFNGCLVIGNNTDGIKEQFDNGLLFSGKEIGIRFNYASNDLLQKFNDIANNGIEYYFPIIENSISVVSSLSSVEQCNNKIYSLYKSILEDQKLNRIANDIR